ncbi:hypothetical protein EXS54_00070 [Patescibacteria group bacterium]|nr:hypothetical protein [Patescibacteria group bacterium]
MPQKTTNKPPQRIYGRLRTLVQAGLLAIVALLPLAYVGVKNGYIEGYSTIYTVPKFYPLEALIAMVFVLWVAFRSPSWRNLKVFWPVFAALGISLLSVTWALVPNLAVVITSHYLIALLLCVMLATELTKPVFLKRIMAVLVGVAAFESVWAIAQYLVQRDLGLQAIGENILRPPFEQIALVPGGADGVLRAYGSLPHPNVLSALLAPALLILIWALWRTVQSPIRQWGLGALSALIGVALLLTFSRTAWVTVAIAAGALIITLWRTSKKQPWGLVIPLVAVVIVSILILKPIENRANPENAVQVGVGHRTVQYEAASQIIGQQPWGVGAGNYSPVIDELRPDLTPYQRQPVHNLLLLVTAELGVIAAGLLVWFLGDLIWRLVRLKASGESFQLKWLAFWMLITALAMGLTDHFFLTLPHGLWLLAVIVAFAVSRLPIASKRRP